jgi:regulator of sirC expression with transglutaminase-like and TPR domain
MGKTVEALWQEVLDEETTEQITADLERFSTAKFLNESRNALAAALHAELVKRLALAANPQDALELARSARSTWLKN